MTRRKFIGRALLAISLLFGLVQHEVVANSWIRVLWGKSPDSDTDRFCIALWDECLGLIDSTGRVVVRFDQPRRDQSDFFDGLMAMEDPATRKVGYIDADGDWAIPPAFVVALPFQGGHAVVKEVLDSPWRLIDRNGRFVGPPSQYGVEGFRHGLAPTRPNANALAGFVNAAGEWAIPPRFRKASAFSTDDGLAAVREAERDWGYIDVKGEYRIPPSLLLARPFSHGRAAVISEGPCWHRIEADPLSMEPVKFLVLRPGRDGESLRERPAGIPECRMRLIDTHGRGASKYEVQSFQDITEEGASAKVAGKWGIMGRDGEWITPPVWDETGAFSEGLAAVYKRGVGWGYVDTLGIVAINLEYAAVQPFSEGLAAVLDKRDRKIYIRPDGAQAFDREFSRVSPFRRGLAHVMVDRDTFEYIDKAGRTVFRYSRAGLGPGQR